MDQKELLDDLLRQRKELQSKLVEVQQEYAAMKDQFIRLQGAIDVLEHLLKEETQPGPEGFDSMAPKLTQPLNLE